MSEPSVADEVVRVFIVDDHDVVRRGLMAVLTAQPDLEVVGEAATARAALTGIDRCLPDIAVIDVRLGDGDGIDVCRSVRRRHPEVACIILTSFGDDRTLVDAASAGAAAFVLKQVEAGGIIDAIRAVAGGRQLLDRAVVRRACERLRRSDEGALESLTSRERAVFDLIGHGLANKDIATELYLAEKTVKNYVSSILAKLGLTRRTEIAAMSARVNERATHRYD